MRLPEMCFTITEIGLERRSMFGRGFMRFLFLLNDIFDGVDCLKIDLNYYRG